MAQFKGTIQEYHDHIGPRLRNKINYLVRKDRDELNGICQDCGQERELQSAHVHGRGRRMIIEEVLTRYQNDGIVEGDLLVIENAILVAHEPIETTFKFLCQACHSAYDRGMVQRPERQIRERAVRVQVNNNRAPGVIRIGQHVRTTFDYLILHDKINELMVRNLLDEHSSHETFELNYPFLRRQEAGMYDVNGYGRYYANTVRVNGHEYYLCSQWLERHRNAFDNWVTDVKGEIN